MFHVNLPGCIVRKICYRVLHHNHETHLKTQTPTFEDGEGPIAKTSHGFLPSGLENPNPPQKKIKTSNRKPNYTLED